MNRKDKINVYEKAPLYLNWPFSCFYGDGDTELARAVDVMMAQAKRVYT